MALASFKSPNYQTTNLNRLFLLFHQGRDSIANTFGLRRPLFRPDVQLGANRKFPTERGVMLTKHAIVMNSKDNVATVVENVEPGSDVRVKSSDGETTVMVKENIPAGHKFAIAGIAVGQPAVKYGETIGVATHNILVGE